MNATLERPTRTSTERFYPMPVDIYEDANGLVIEAALAGVDPSQVEVTLEQQRLVLSALGPTAADGQRYLHNEIFHGNWRRVFNLPEEIDPERAQATCSNGLLRLVLPRRAPERKLIPINH